MKLYRNEKILKVLSQTEQVVEERLKVTKLPVRLAQQKICSGQAAVSYGVCSVDASQISYSGGS